MLGSVQISVALNCTYQKQAGNLGARIARNRATLNRNARRCCPGFNRDRFVRRLGALEGRPRYESDSG